MGSRFQGQRLFSLKENHQSFFARIVRRYNSKSWQFKMIMRAYKTAKEASRSLGTRESGEREFEHYRRVPLILIDHLGILKYHPRAHILICAGLQHDVVEDNEEWSFERITKYFGREVSELVFWMTKVDEKEYHARFCCAPRDFFLIKLADRWDNMTTIWACPLEKVIRKIKETEEFYLPYAKKYQILYPELCLAIRRAKRYVARRQRQENKRW